MKSALIWLATASSTISSSIAEPVSSPSTTIENSLGMKFVLIPAGEFMMGSDESPDSLARSYPQYDRKRLKDLSDESPVHKVRITHAFYLGQYEVTVGQFRRFIEQSGYVPESEKDGTGGYGYNADYDPGKTVRGDAFEGRDPKYSWRNPGFAQSDDHPVVNVSWNDAVAMSKWLSEKEGVAYRLPTEAEWEYAARAGTTTRYHSGDAPQSLLKAANIFDADAVRFWKKWKNHALAESDGYPFTAPAGSFMPNAFGIYDMHGNAWEWTGDWYDDGYYAISPVNDPKGPSNGSVRVRRGGSWHTWPLYARSAYRNWNSQSTRYTLVGMRLVRELK
jgi:formylglycine-generating enzyme required for sulfatase activity